jgi:hypothetical protein
LLGIYLFPFIYFFLLLLSNSVITVYSNLLIVSYFPQEIVSIDNVVGGGEEGNGGGGGQGNGGGGGQGNGGGGGCNNGGGVLYEFPFLLSNSVITVYSNLLIVSCFPQEIVQLIMLLEAAEDRQRRRRHQWRRGK